MSLRLSVAEDLLLHQQCGAQPSCVDAKDGGSPKEVSPKSDSIQEHEVGMSTSCVVPFPDLHPLLIRICVVYIYIYMYRNSIHREGGIDIDRWID